MSQDHLEGMAATMQATDMQTGGRRDEDTTLRERAEGVAEDVQQRYGKAKQRIADLADTATGKMASAGEEVRERLEELDPSEVGQAAWRRMKGAQWPLLLIGGAMGFGLAAWLGASDKKPTPSPRRHRRS